MLAESIVNLSNIHKSYKAGSNRISVLRNIDLIIHRGELLSIMGPSGSGKSTLLNILGALDRPDSGQYLFNGESMLQKHDKDLSAFRAKSIGFVFQTFNLVPSLNLIDNVKLPFFYTDVSGKNRDSQALEVIKLVGLENRIRHKPFELSGGEMQRCAIARAVAANPEMILADEPTGNLDSKTGREILNLLEMLNSKGTTVVLITHDHHVAGRADRSVTLMDGGIIESS